MNKFFNCEEYAYRYAYRNDLEIKFKKINDDAIIPNYIYNYDSGFDLYSIDNELIYPGKISQIHTGIIIQLPNPTKSYPFVLELQIRPRSGLALKHGITVVNSPGTIDNTYRGEIIIIMTKLKYKKEEYNVDDNYYVKKGDKIAQGVLVPILSNNCVTIKETNTIDKTERNSNGFGSTDM